MNTVLPITFIDKLVKKNELASPSGFIDHQREVLIDGTDAKLRIEALSRPWSFDTDRREKEPFGITSPTRFRFLSQR